MKNNNNKTIVNSDKFFVSYSINYADNKLRVLSLLKQKERKL